MSSYSSNKIQAHRLQEQRQEEGWSDDVINETLEWLDNLPIGIKYNSGKDQSIEIETKDQSFDWLPGQWLLLIGDELVLMDDKRFNRLFNQNVDVSWYDQLLSLLPATAMTIMFFINAKYFYRDPSDEEAFRLTLIYLSLFFLLILASCTIIIQRLREIKSRL